MESSSGQVNLLISLLIRYAELGMVNYRPEEDTIKLVFLLKQHDESHYIEFQQQYGAHIEAYKVLSGRTFSVSRLNRVDSDSLTTLEVIRDLSSLSREEINIIINLISSVFKEYLLVEDTYVSTEELVLQDDLIESILAADPEITNESYIGFRDKGKVLVFSHESTPTEEIVGS